MSIHSPPPACCLLARKGLDPKEAWMGKLCLYSSVFRNREVRYGNYSLRAELRKRENAPRPVKVDEGVRMLNRTIINTSRPPTVAFTLKKVWFLLLTLFRSNRSLLNSFDEDIHEENASEDSDEELPPKRIALNQTSVPRYHKEFHEISLLGKGEFGSVHKCLNRLDGCVYAVKKSLMPVAGSPNE